MEDKTTNHAATNAQPNTAGATAAGAYAAKANDIARLIDVLQMELEKHQTLAKADAKNWGRVGDLGQVREKLIEMISFLSGMEQEWIETFLAD